MRFERYGPTSDTIPQLLRNIHWLLVPGHGGPAPSRPSPGPGPEQGPGFFVRLVRNLVRIQMHFVVSPAQNMAMS